MSIYHSQNKYHYTYEIVVEHNITNEPGKYYIGVRSCKCLPEDDIKYLGSSKYLTKFLKEHPEAKVTKTILAYFLTSEDAIQHEIKLHGEFNVAESPEFFNRAKQTSTGFSVEGCSVSTDTRKKMSCAKKGRPGIPKNDETRKKISESRKGQKLTQEHKDKLKNRKFSIEHLQKLKVPKLKTVCRIADHKEFNASNWYRYNT